MPIASKTLVLRLRLAEESIGTNCISKKSASVQVKAPGSWDWLIPAAIKRIGTSDCLR